VQHSSQLRVCGQADIGKGLVEASDCSAIHLVVLAVSAVHPNDCGLVAVGSRIGRRAAERLGPVRRETLDVMGVEAVAERMGDYVISQHSIMPSNGETPEPNLATCRLKDRSHAAPLWPTREIVAVAKPRVLFNSPLLCLLIAASRVKPLVHVSD
jgi:hypothetical protein